MKDFKLDNEPKIKTGFKVPGNYFGDFEERIMQQLPHQEARVVPLYKRRPVWLAAVAAIFIIALSLTLVFRTDTAAQPDDATIEDYLVYQANISTYDLVSELDENDIAELEETITLSDAAIEEYLLEENIYVNE